MTQSALEYIKENARKSKAARVKKLGGEEAYIAYMRKIAENSHKGKKSRKSRAK